MLLACSPKYDVDTKFHDIRSIGSEVQIGRGCARTHTHAHEVCWSQEPTHSVYQERNLAQGRNKWRAAVHTVMYLQFGFHKIRGIFD